MLRALRPLARQTAVPRALPAARRWATTVNGEEHHSPSEVAPPPPPGVPVDPQLNGYPQLPYVSLQTREPFGWWDIQERKNFNELVHEEEDVLGMWGPDVHKISPGRALAQIGIAASLIAAFGYLIYQTAPESPVARREYPYDGLSKELGGWSKARVEEPEVDE
ncbi:uncharacterized protein LOC62_03G003621 [Vanrija pseudolonga]|uniref:Uncharacterized protein n=1 Tax=Vanrija pseudolonga TaxID=143232 RepID=A0AAF0Y4V0_9TREE|nr:hypothetical protein LOC62_03G003621 [Vanrija pseudolonga]